MAIVVISPPSVVKDSDLDLAAEQLATPSTSKDGTNALAAKRHALDALIAQCDLNAALPKDLALWDKAQPTGNEVW